MEPLKHKDLELVPKLEGDTLTIVWRGRSLEMRPEQVLDPYFEDLVEESDNDNLRLVLDFREMDFMNSSTISPIMRVIRDLNSRRVSTEVLYRAGVGWQVASFVGIRNVLTSHDYEHVAIRPDPEPQSGEV